MLPALLLLVCLPGEMPGAAGGMLAAEVTPIGVVAPNKLGTLHRPVAAWELEELRPWSEAIPSAREWNSPTPFESPFADASDASNLALVRLPDVDSEERAAEKPLGVWSLVGYDHQNFYRRERLAKLALVLGGAAAIANSTADQEFQDWWQADVRGSVTDGIGDVGKVFGEGYWMVPLVCTACIVGELFPENPAAVGLWRWGGRTARAYLVGGPPMVLLQYTLGASRPYESDHNSEWRFWNDVNGVAGHAFMGAVPFLTAAQFSDDWRVKTACYAAAGLTGFSRLNDNSHYASQVLIAWWMAWAATQSVQETALATNTLHAVPMPMGDGMGFVFFWER